MALTNRWKTRSDFAIGLISSPRSNARPKEDAVRYFINDILHNRVITAVSQTDDTIDDKWITDDPVSELKYKPAAETIEFRSWSGHPASERT